METPIDKQRCTNNKMAKTPANGNLFNINVLSYKLSQDKADICIA